MENVLKITIAACATTLAGVVMLLYERKKEGGNMESTGTMTDAGYAFIMQNEGLRLRAYQDSGGVWTIGYGHTGSDVKSGTVISKERAAELLRKDVAWAVAAVKKATAGVALMQRQFEALVDFTYNVGAGNLNKSTLLKKVKANANDKSSISAEFRKWVYAGGKVVNGLRNRREKEIAYYFG